VLGVDAQALSVLAKLRDDTGRLAFADPVAHVYHPLHYAWPMMEAYVRRYGAGRKRVIFVGMNPGPWGMAQTGVPFGEVAAVRDWLRLAAPIGQPSSPHPARPVQGLACQRAEVSGKRLWGLFAARYEQPEAFFADHLVLNYCPLLFLEAGGRNRTPDKLPAGESRPLHDACDAALAALVDIYRPQWCIGVGAYAQQRLRQVTTPPGTKVGVVLHPSPASPAANRGWAEAASAQLTGLGVW
jgi:single-strand selective monofunctional uracil DNA glycosylase